MVLVVVNGPLLREKWKYRLPIIDNNDDVFKANRDDDDGVKIRMGNQPDPNVYERRVSKKNSPERKMSDYKNFQQLDKVRRLNAANLTVRKLCIQRGTWVTSVFLP